MRRSDSRLNCEVPKSYVFKKRKDLMRNDGAISDNLQPVGEEYIPEERWNPHPRRSLPINHGSAPRSYVFRRIQFSNEEMHETNDDESILNRRRLSSEKNHSKRDTSPTYSKQKEDKDERYDDLMKPFRFENVPKTYRFKSSYSREEPPGTYQKQLPHNKQIIKEKEKNVPSDSIGMRRIDLTLGMNNASRSALKQICGCWFSLYNGYCNGHENDSRPYFNSNSRLGHGGNEHLSIWTENPNHENDKKGFPYRDNNVVIHRNHSVSQNPYCDNNAVQQRRQGSRSGMNSHKNDSFYQEYITDDDCVSDEN